MESSTNELIENQELMNALYSLEYTFDELNKEYEKKKSVLEEETDKMTTEFFEATNKVRNILNKEKELDYEYDQKKRHIKPWFGVTKPYKVIMPAGFFPLLFMQPWNWEEGISSILITLIAWGLCTAGVTGFILLPAMFKYEKYSNSKIDSDKKIALAMLRPQLDREITQIKEQYLVYKEFGSVEQIIDSRYDNEHSELLSEYKNKRESAAREFNHIYPAYLKDTIRSAIEWIENREVKTMFDLLNKAEKLHDRQHVNGLQLKYERSEKAFKETRLYKNHYSRREEENFTGDEPHFVDSYSQPEEQLGHLEIDRKRWEGIKSETTKQYQELQTLYADQARRNGEDRDTVKHLDELAGRGLQERIDSDRRWSYRDNEHNMDRGGSY